MLDHPGRPHRSPVLWQHRAFSWAVGIGSVLVLSASLGQSVSAKPIIPDGTTHTWIDRHGNIHYIKGGFRRGHNLFHSFRKFNVPKDEIALFMHTIGIQNILVRVTGMSISKIMGTLSTQEGSTANLFFMNPNGIIFGAGSALNVGGSFVGTTAHAIRLKNGDIFSSNPTKPLPQQILRVKPSAFLFNQMAVKPIVIRATDGLDVDEGKSLLFIGGDVRINHGQLHAFGGRIELGGLAGKGTVGLNIKGDSLKLSFSENQLLANVYLSHSAGVFAGSFLGDGGDILIHASNVRLDNSTLYVGIFGRDNNTAGKIKINADGNVIFNKSFATSTVEGVKGDSGLIVIKAGSFIMKNGSSLSVQNSGTGSAGKINLYAEKIIINDGNTPFNLDLYAGSNNGNGGKINIYANMLKAIKGAAFYANSENGDGGQIHIYVQDKVIFDQSSARSFTRSQGDAGIIKIDTNSLILRNGSKLDSSNYGEGNSGKIIINATNKVYVDDSFISVDVFNTGYVGQIKVSAGSLFLKNGAQISAQLYGGNDGLNSGQIFIKVKDLFHASGMNEDRSSGILSQIEGVEGRAGNIKIVSGSLVLTDGAIFATSTKGDGNAGNITIRAADDVRIDGALIQSNVEDKPIIGDAGNAGNIKINADSIFVTGGSEITSFTKSSGNAGDIILTATDLVHISDEGTKILSEFIKGSTGNGGEIKIVTDDLLVKNDALISTKTFDKGWAGDIVVRAKGLVRFDHAEATSLADTQSDGDAGDISIRADRLSLQNGGALSTDSQGTGKAGTLVTNSNVLALNNGFISSSSFSGDGGDINLTVRDLLTLKKGSRISTDAGSSGTGGNINIQNKTGFIVAFPGNSDITANAGTGDGGQVTIRTQGLYGIQPQPQLTDGNDITASSQQGVQGTVTINRPDVDPTKDLSRLPDVVEDVSSLITQQCPTDETSGQFTVTGRGGIPPSPTDSLSSDATSVGLVQVPHSGPTSLRPSLQAVPSQTETGAIASHQESAPATGWIFNETGDVTLVAQSNINLASSIPLNSPQSCPALAGSNP